MTVNPGLVWLGLLIIAYHGFVRFQKFSIEAGEAMVGIKPFTPAHPSKVPKEMLH